MLLTELKLRIFSTGTSQRALARSLGIPETRLSNIIRGVVAASETERELLMRELGAGAELFQVKPQHRIEVRS